MYGVEVPTFRKVDKRYIESIEMWCWRRMEKIGFTDCVKDGLHIDQEEGTSNKQSKGGKQTGLV